MAFTLSVSQSPGGKPTAVRVAEVVRKGDPRAPGPLPLLALHCAWPQSRVSVLISCLFLLYLATGTCAPPPFSISSVMSRKQPEPHLTPRGQRERVNHRAGPKGEGPPDSSSGLWWSGAARGAGGGLIFGSCPLISCRSLPQVGPSSWTVREARVHGQRAGGERVWRANGSKSSSSQTSSACPFISTVRVAKPRLRISDLPKATQGAY